MNRYCRKKVVDLYVVGTSREDEINDYIYEQNYGTDKDYDDYDMVFKKTSNARQR